MIYRIVVLTIVSLFFIGAKMRDPTKPPLKLAPKKSVENEVFRLNLVKLSQNGKHVATINGENVYEGGMYADAKVVKIEANKVTLIGPKGEQIVLKLVKRHIRDNQKDEFSEETFPDIKVSPSDE